MSDEPFEWWEYDTAGTQVLPTVVGPEIPFIPVSESERCEMGALDRLGEWISRTPEEVVKEKMGAAYDAWFAEQIRRGRRVEHSEIDWDAVAERVLTSTGIIRRSKRDEYKLLEPSQPPTMAEIGRNSARNIIYLLTVMIVVVMIIGWSWVMFGM